MGLREVLIAVVLPGFVSLVVLVGAALMTGRRRRGEEERGRSGLGWLVAIFISGGAVLGSYAWQTRMDVWPASATHRFPFVAGVALAAGIAAFALGRRGRAAAAVVAGFGGGVVAWAFLSLLHDSLISEGARWGWIAGCGVLTGVMAWTLEAAGERLLGWRGPGLLAIVAGLSALGVTEAFANGPLILGAAAAVLGGATVAALAGRRAAWFPGPGAAVAVMLVGTLVFANWFGDRERWVMFGLLAAGPMAAGVCLVPAVARRGANVRFAAAAGVAVVVLGVQAARAIPPLIEAMRPAGEMDYEY